jgi:hypothetical protein
MAYCERIERAVVVELWNPLPETYLTCGAVVTDVLTWSRLVTSVR